MTVIDKEEREFLDENGFCIFRNLIDKEKLILLENDIQTLFDPYALEDETIHNICVRLDKDEKPLLYKLYSTIMTFSSFLSISVDCMNLSKHLLPDGITTSAGNAVMFGLPNDKRLVYDWHQESSYMTYKDTIHFQFPVFRNATIENGTMSVLRGSHKLGELKYDSVQKSKDALVNLTVRDIKSYVEELEEVPFLMNIGDVGVFFNNTIHRSNHNKSQYVRFSGVIRANSIKTLADEELIKSKKARESSS